MLSGQGLARPVRTLAAAALGYGQVTLGGEASGAGPGTLGTPGPRGPGTLKGPRVQLHWLRLKRHLAMAWRRRRQRVALARHWPGNIFLEMMIN